MSNTSQSALTLAFENYLAQSSANYSQIQLDEVVLAFIPDLDTTLPIDRTETLPPASQIVHRQAVDARGVINANAVAYSITMGSNVGDFSFNWLGLINKSSGMLAMVIHAPTMEKLATKDGQQGNALTRSFLTEYNGAATATGITTPAQTWQIDFTARLHCIDEAQRMAFFDIYGAGAFYDDGFLVTGSGSNFSIKAGIGYVGGLRAELEKDHAITLGTKPTKIWVDVSWSGTVTSSWAVHVEFKAASSLADYVDAAGVAHYVFAIAAVDSAGKVTDLRPKGTLSDSALADHEKNSGVHKIAAVEGLQSALDGKAPDGYGLGESATALVDFNALKIPSGFYAGAGGSDVSNIPAPYGCGFSIYRAGGSDGNGFQGQLLIDSDSAAWVRGSVRTIFAPWAKLYTTQNKPPIEAVVGLQAALDGKASTSHTQAISTITGLQAALDEKSPSAHYHSIGGVNGLQDALNGKSPNGYGLGTEARNMSDANAIGVGCGFYAGGGAGAQNFFDAYSPMLHVFRSGGNDNTGIITQMQATRGRLAFRTRENNVWFGWHELAPLTSTLGYSQKWKDVTSSRSSGVNYTNSTGRPVQIFVSTVPSKNTCSAQITVDGVVVASMSLGGNQNLDYTRHTSVSAIIPVGAVYKVDATSIQRWSELS